MTDRLNARIAIPLLAVVGAPGCGGGDTGSTTPTPAATTPPRMRDPAATFTATVAEYEQHMRRCHRAGAVASGTTRIRGGRTTETTTACCGRSCGANGDLADVEINRPADAWRQAVRRRELTAIQGSCIAATEAEGKQHRVLATGQFWGVQFADNATVLEGIRPSRDAIQRLTRRQRQRWWRDSCFAKRSWATWTTERSMPS